MVRVGCVSVFGFAVEQVGFRSRLYRLVVFFSSRFRGCTGLFCFTFVFGVAQVGCVSVFVFAVEQVGLGRG